MFHLYKGVRAGGGIGDEIEPPDGDEYEVYRILFDISFFFFIIVILLAIIQGKVWLFDLERIYEVCIKISSFGICSHFSYRHFDFPVNPSLLF